MFRQYEEAAVCYAYLVNVDAEEVEVKTKAEAEHPNYPSSEFRGSRKVVRRTVDTIIL